MARKIIKNQFKRVKPSVSLFFEDKIFCVCKTIPCSTKFIQERFFCTEIDALRYANSRNIEYSRFGDVCFCFVLPIHD